MDTLRRLNWIEWFCFANLLVLFMMIGLDGGVSDFKPLTYSVDILWFIPWVITAIPAVSAAIYGLKTLHSSHLDSETHHRRFAVYTIVLVVNFIVFAAAVVPNSFFEFNVVDMNSLFRRAE